MKSSKNETVFGNYQSLVNATVNLNRVAFHFITAIETI